mmetsp:Transcript_50323/g.57742  ORF Transcript_50323/g.57742 Transcript_50323/m.57742 type:complete len:283 (+) Transcript_50323:1-849(+)
MQKLMFETARRYPKGLSVTWVDGNKNRQKKEKAGLRGSKLPAMALNLPGGKVIAYGGDAEISSATIDDFLLNNVHSLHSAGSKSETKKTKKDTQDTLKSLSKLTEADSKSLSKVRKNDVIVLIYAENQPKLDQFAYVMSHVGKRFKELGIESVEFLRHLSVVDGSKETGKEYQRWATQEPPRILFKPANDKTFTPFDQEVTALTLMKYLEKNCVRKFKLPQVSPHISATEYESYEATKQRQMSEKSSKSNEDEVVLSKEELAALREEALAEIDEEEDPREDL